jgi:hypothetical protein
LEGHLTETNYGADWGDFVSFASQMKAKAKAMGVDLLLIDTGMHFVPPDEMVVRCSTTNLWTQATFTTVPV